MEVQMEDDNYDLQDVYVYLDKEDLISLKEHIDYLLNKL